MIKTPSFRYMGGKSRLRKWLLSYFPKTGRKYIEPFAGLGNVFFQAKKDLKFEEWHLGDIDISFFIAMLNANFDDLPDKVSKNDFLVWRNINNSISKIIEPKITFAGKGYQAGFDGGHISHPPYNGKLHRIICEEARRLLFDVNVKEISWEKQDYAGLTYKDFVYFDPPYFGTKASYPNINHMELVKLLNTATFRWALSGYDNELYSSSLKFTDRYCKIRNSELKSSNSGKYEAVCEILWLGGGCEDLKPKFQQN